MAEEGGDTPYVRKRRFIRYRLGGYGIEMNEVAAGEDAPYEPQDARFWWTVVGLIVVVVVAAAVAIAVLG